MAFGNASAFADCLNDFNSLVHGNQKSGPYQINADFRLTDEHGQYKGGVTVTMQVVYPDLHRNVVDFFKKITREDILVGGKMWGNSYGKWIILPAKYARNSEDALNSEGFLTSVIVQNVRCLGNVSMDASTDLAFSYDSLLGPIPIQVIIYFNPLTKFPIKAEGSGKGSGLILESHVNYEFNSRIKIEAPPI